MRIKEAIVLAGGLGTRLRSAVPDLPKCMAPVAGRPFLAYLLDYYIRKGVERFIFSLGYKHETIEGFIADHYPLLDKTFSVEEEPLGTGGAIKLAISKALQENVLILNGDTFFKIDNQLLAARHTKNNAGCTICLKPMHSFDRYGVVELNDNDSVRSFKEKQFYDQGLINGGVYALNKKAFEKERLPVRFSFETAFLEAAATREDHTLYGLVQEEYFIDIGIPEDFERAQHELPDNIGD